MITGHEEEFRQLFAEEAASRLARLGEQLLQLEKTGSDPELIASIFREAHTLKGAAAVVGIEDASRVAHALEDLLEGVRVGDQAPTSALVDVALAAVDGLTAMIPQLLAGDDCSEQAAALEEGVRRWSESGELPELAESAEAPPESVVLAEEEPQTGRAQRTDSETINVPAARLDELVRLVGESAAAHLRIGRVLTERLGVDAGTVPEFRDLSRVLNDLQERTMRARMVPVFTITDQLHRGVRDLARSLGKDVRWEVRGEDTELDRGVLQHLADPLMHLVRNAIDHGIETPTERVAAGKSEQATLRLHAMQLGSEVVIAVIDDGRGIDVARVRERAMQRGNDVTGLSDEDALLLIFHSGLSTADSISEVSGRGVGLDVVRTSIDALRGRVEVRSEPGAGSEFRIIVPITLAVLPCLLLSAGGQRYAIPMHSVTVSQAHDPERGAHAEGRPLVWVGDSTVPVSSLQETLGVAGECSTDGPVVVAAGVTRRHAFQVDALLGQRDVVVKGLGRLLARIDVLAGASVEPDGSILLVLDAPGLIDRARLTLARDGGAIAPPDEDSPRTVRRSVLVVDDALTVRELQRSILERAGFDVCVASDGVEALALLAEAPVDLVLTDLEMPRMDGFGLTEAIRAHPTLANLPVLMLTSRSSDVDRQRGLEVGADGYIIKSSFDEASLLSAVNGLLGRRT
jgi:two-component system chemotaxis sensor kinase CheA